MIGPQSGLISQKAQTPVRGRGLCCYFKRTLQGGNGAVQGLAWAHHLGGQLGIRGIVATDVGWLALNGVELGDDSLLVLGQGFCQRGEACLQGSVVSLGSQGLGPVQGQVEVAAAVVDTANFARRRLVGVEELAGSLVQGVGQNLARGLS